MFLSRTYAPLAVAALVACMMVFGCQSPSGAQSVFCVAERKIVPCNKTSKSKLPTPHVLQQQPTKPDDPSASPARAESSSTKADLRGFFPGMTIAAFQEVLKTIGNIKCIESDFSLRCTAKNVNGTIDRYEFSFSTQPNVLLNTIRLQFSSSTRFENLITQISTQYGLEPRPFPPPPGGIIFWNLRDDRVLAFSTVFGSRGDYELTVSSERLRHTERKVFDNGITVNPTPKF